MINGNITVGLELECSVPSPNYKRIVMEQNFSERYDASIKGRRGEDLPRRVEDGGGLEVVTPVYDIHVAGDSEGKRLRLNYGNLEARIYDLCACALEINESCGVHVHLGRPQAASTPPPAPPPGAVAVSRRGAASRAVATVANNATSALAPSLWKPDHVRTMLAIGLLLEEKLFKLVPQSRLSSTHCAPIRSKFSPTDLQSFYPLGEVHARKCDNAKRYCWMNLIETKRQGTDPVPGHMASPATGTIEIRMLGNTRRPNYIFAWTKLWAKVAAYVAYFPATFAIMHCCLTNSIEPELAEVENFSSRAE
jgi:hypothetical protein